MEAMRVPLRCSGTPEREQYLSLDLQLEIVARSDITTVVRCAATSRILRRAILEPAFRRRLAADGGGFDPALLLGVSIRSKKGDAYRVIHTPCSAQPLPRVLLGASSLRDWFTPMASRDGLLLYRMYDHKLDAHAHQRLSVCDTLTGHATTLPQIALSNIHWYAFLGVGESYELLAVEIRMRFQTFSSKHGQWGAVRQLSIPEHEQGGTYELACASPAVVRRTVYWPCGRFNNNDQVCWEGIVAMDVEAAQGTIMEHPPGWFTDKKEDTCNLVASVCGFLSLFVVENGGISMWTFTPASAKQSTATWSRQLLIDKVEIEKAVGQVDYTSMSFLLAGFGERSGSVIVRVGKADLLRLDIGTKVIKRLHNEGDVLIDDVLFLHEADVVSLIQAMKYF